MEWALRQNRLLEAALIAALDAVPSPAFLLDDSGIVHAANREGRRLLEREPEAAHAALGEWQNGGTRFDIEPITQAGRVAHALVSQRRPTPLHAKIASLAARWKLTQRQTEVLEQLALGHANKIIASELGCSENTVEAHVTAVLSKARAASRLEILARLLAD